MSKCKICRGEFVKRSMKHKVCSTECGIEWAKRERVKRERIEYRKRRQKLKPRSEYVREAQAVFNRYIRERDRDLPCISCGRFHSGSYDAGHYRTVGAAPQLRFNEDNCHKQCVPCNHNKSGNAVEYRIGLVQRIGEDRVAALESANDPAKHTIDDAIRIKDEYTRKWMELKRDRGD